MNRLTKPFLLIILFISVQTTHVQLASVIPKPDLMNTLNDVTDLRFSDDQSSALKKHDLLHEMGITISPSIS